LLQSGERNLIPLKFNSPPFRAYKLGVRGFVLRIRKDFKEKSSIPRTRAKLDPQFSRIHDIIFRKAINTGRGI
jgi:hypothetical protein